MSNISIYLTAKDKEKLDLLVSKGLAEDLLNGVINAPERSRSAIVAMLIDREFKKLEEAEMIADAVEIDNSQLGWTSKEELCQISDMEASG